MGQQPALTPPPFPAPTHARHPLKCHVTVPRPASHPPVHTAHPACLLSATGPGCHHPNSRASHTSHTYPSPPLSYTSRPLHSRTPKLLPFVQVLAAILHLSNVVFEEPEGRHDTSVVAPGPAASVSGHCVLSPCWWRLPVLLPLLCPMRPVHLACRLLDPWCYCCSAWLIRMPDFHTYAALST